MQPSAVVAVNKFEYAPAVHDVQLVVLVVSALYWPALQLVQPADDAGVREYHPAAAQHVSLVTVA